VDEERRDDRLEVAAGVAAGPDVDLLGAGLGAVGAGIMQ